MRKSYVLGAAVVGAAVCCSAAEAGPVQILSQSRRVQAIAAPANADQDVVNVAAPDGGPFEATAAADASGEGFIARATASVASTLRNDGFHFAGTLSWETQDTRSPGSAVDAGADAAFFGSIRFRLDEPYDFSFARSQTVTQESTSGAESQEGWALLTSEDLTLSFSPGQSGTLQPGDYHLEVSKIAQSLIAGEGLDRFALDYAFDLNLAPSDGSSEPNPIPLPPTAWAALWTMGLIGLTRARRLLPTRG